MQEQIEISSQEGVTVFQATIKRRIFTRQRPVATRVILNKCSSLEIRERAPFMGRLKQKSDN